ncbi:unnamed protein product [Paramecium primaurelia]|uniref:Myb-like domain-containing protein n=1 Tax=Paramecium primaurelia TaxID=5886 RepID=A0A8S1KER6_PARPR|nr:unnamed protein product [Paramecium primaurelia]
MKSDVTVPAIPICSTQELSQSNNPRSGHWTQAEHKLYLDFLYQSQDLIESSQNNKGQRLFKKMSQVIATRSPSQCRYNFRQPITTTDHITKNSIHLMFKQQKEKKVVNYLSQSKKYHHKSEEELNQNIQ